MKGGLFKWLFRFLLQFFLWVFLNPSLTVLLPLRAIIFIKDRIFGLLYDGFLELTFDPTFLGSSV